MPKRRQPDTPHDGPGSHDAAGVKRGKAKGVERQDAGDDVRRGLTAYVETGRFRRAGKRTGIAWETIRDWVRSGQHDDMLAQIRHAHAREVRAAFAGTASAYARELAEVRRAAYSRALQIAEEAKTGGEVNGNELSALLRSLASTAETVARIGDIVSDPASLEGRRPAHFLVTCDRPDDGAGG